MTSIHQELIGRVSNPRLDAVLLDTPFGFQENADEVAVRTISYFREHVGCEIYKVGADPTWTEGLDLLGEIGLRCAVIPHYDNREGGTHDTRFCYMGESRLRLLESLLPDDVPILGVDEYTACIVDIEAQSVTVRGRVGVAVRRRGIDRRWERTTFALSELSNPLVAPAPALAVRPPEPEGTDGSPMLEQAREWALQGRHALD